MFLIRAAFVCVLAFATSLVAFGATPVVKSGKITKDAKQNQVTVVIKGLFPNGAFDPTKGLDVTAGFAQLSVPFTELDVSPSGEKMTFHGGPGALLKKASFDLGKRRFSIQCVISGVADYANPLVLSVTAGKHYSFHLPVNVKKKKTVFKGKLAGIGGGNELGAAGFGLAGGSHDFGSIAMDVSPGAIVSPIQVKVLGTELPKPLPPGMIQLGTPLDVSVHSTTGLNPFERAAALTMKLAPGSFDPGQQVCVLHFNPTLGDWEPTTLLGVDSAAGKIRFESRSFSSFVAVLLDLVLPGSHAVTHFAPGQNGWSIDNFGSYFSSNGNCLGMSGYSTWFFQAHASQNRFETYSGAPAKLTATRAHMALSQVWNVGSQQFSQQQSLEEATVGALMKALLWAFDRPLVMVMYDASVAAGHAVVCYGYTEDSFLIYDVNFAAQTKFVPFSTATGFGTYSGDFIKFGYLGSPSLGRDQDFQVLYQDAANGFYGDLVQISSPTEGQTVLGDEVVVSGTVDDPTWDTVIVWLNGVDKISADVVAGEFSVNVPIVDGPNSVVVLAGSSLNQQSLFAPGSGVGRVDFTADTMQHDLLVTLTWGEAVTDVDLYAHEPNGDVAWYADKSTLSGGILDFDDTNGFGPEHYTNGAILEGTYAIRVHYYSDKALGLPATCQVTVLVNHGKVNQGFAARTFTIASDNSANASPGSSGPDWFDVAHVDIQDGSITLD